MIKLHFMFSYHKQKQTNNFKKFKTLLEIISIKKCLLNRTIHILESNVYILSYILFRENNFRGWGGLKWIIR